MLQENNKEEEHENKCNINSLCQRDNKNAEEINRMSRDKAEKYNIDNVIMKVLDRLLGEVFKARMHAEKACKEKNYQLWLTQAYVKELEEALEEKLDLLDEDKSSVLLGV